MEKKYGQLNMQIPKKMKDDIEALAYIQSKSQAQVVRDAIQKTLDDPTIAVQLKQLHERG